MGERVVNEHARRQHEAEQHRQGAGERRQQAARAAERLFRQVAIFAGRVMEAALGPERPLEQQQRSHEQQHDAGDLRRAGQIVAVEPGVVDGDRQGPHAEELDRADIVQRLHQRQRDAGRQRRPGQRQGDLPEGLRRRAPERAAYLEHAYRLRDEARPRGDVDVRIEHRAHHQDRAAEAANVGEPIAPRVAPAE